MNQYIVVLRGINGATFNIPVVAESSGAAQSKLENQLITEGLIYDKVLEVKYNRVAE